jgi:hypothetical protein
MQMNQKTDKYDRSNVFACTSISVNELAKSIILQWDFNFFLRELAGGNFIHQL